MNKLYQLIVGASLMLGVSSGFAVKVNSLYHARVPVISQSAEERRQAVQTALTQVLIKVSGNNRILDNALIKSHLALAEKLIQEYGYSAVHTPTAPASYLLEIHFDAEGVNQLLRSDNAPIWGQNRPLILAWIECEGSGGPAEIMSSDSLMDVAVLLKQAADQHGLPIIFPMMDVIDLNQISVNDITTMSASTLANAAKRYKSDAILIGRIIQDSQGIHSQWKMVLDNNQWNWNFSGKTMTGVLSAMTDSIMTTLAERYAVITTNTVQMQVTLKVLGVTQQEDFVQLVRYLNHLTPVANAEVMQISGNEVALTISLRGTQQSFMQTLSVGKKLTPINPILWTFQWNH